MNFKKINFNYSLKSIPLHNLDHYRRSIIEKVESVIKRMRWKAHFFLNGEGKSTASTFGLKSKNNPPKVRELNEFEEDMVRMIENLEFRNVYDELLKNLKTDVKQIQVSPNVFVFADKTTNLYEMTSEKYNQLLSNNSMRTYKLGSSTIEDDIHQELKVIADDLGIASRIEPMARKTNLSFHSRTTKKISRRTQNVDLSIRLKAN